ncbi:MAG: DNA polymerase III subunit gamma/tau [Candidatus Tectimicrobiota bacterium]|nr:MAG: DNA polymerase III subunit gamma/tau [Candidatus Tectomicrobia bacterium]
MAYQVTARKWRPQTFDDIVEQEHVTRTLKNAIRLGRIAHAYLFAGTRGVGKTTTARVLAKALNCEHGPTVDPCNRCASCRDIAQGTSLDMVEIDGASNRGIDEIRDLRERLPYLPSRSRYKVYIIDEVHMLTKEAFNALLKTLEEPPPHVVFVFATTELERIPYTIVSRCQRFDFKRVSLAGIVTQLERIARSEGIAISRTSLLRLAKAADGSLRDAESLLDQVVAYCGLQVDDAEVAHLLGQVGGERLAQCLQALLRQDAAQALQLVHAWQAEGYETTSIVRSLLEGLRHLMVLKTVPEPEALLALSEAEAAALRAVAETATVEELYAHFHTLTTAESLLRHASNPFLLLEMTLLRMACIGHVPSLQALLAQLERLAGAQTLPPTSEPGRSPVPSPGPAEPPSPQRPAGEAELWQALLERVMGQRPFVGAMLQEGRLLRCTEEELVIAFAKEGSFSHATLQEAENLAVVREAAAAVVGRPVRVRLVAAPESAPHGPASPPAPDTAAAERPKREIIQDVLDLFDASIVP